MKYHSIFQDIKSGNIGNLYLFFGQEQFLCEELVKALENKLIHPRFKDLNVQCLEGEKGTIEAIENACETLPFMGEKRMILVKNSPFFQGGKSAKDEEGIEYLAEYINKIPPTTCLVFWQKDMDKRKKIYQRINKVGISFECEKLRAPALKKWLVQNFHRKGKRIEEEALHYLVENCDYLSKNSAKNLFDIRNEIHKILDFVGEKKEITKKDIENNLPRMLENDIFKMVDAIGKKDRITALKLLHDLTLQGENEIRILSMIARQFRILIQCKELNEQGYSPNNIAGKIKEAPFVVQKGVAQCRSFHHHSLKKAMYSVLEADKQIKTGRMDKRLALEMLIFENT